MNEPDRSSEVSGAPAPSASSPVNPIVEPLDPSRLWVIAILAGLLAGIVAWGVGELVYDMYKARKVEVVILYKTYFEPNIQTANEADIKNGTVAFVLLGAVLGACLGLAGGLVARKPLRGALAGLLGLVLGALVAWVAVRVAFPIYYRTLVPDPNEFARPLLTLVGIWSSIGAVGGLAFGVGRGGMRRLPVAILSALVGAALGTVLYAIISVAAFSEARPLSPLPLAWPARLLARLFVCGLAAVGAASAFAERLRPAVGKTANADSLLSSLLLLVFGAAGVGASALAVQWGMTTAWASTAEHAADESGPRATLVEFAGSIEPPTVPGREASWKDEEEVIGVVLEGRARAYRAASLSLPGWHIVNDRVGQVPLSITYCNLDRCARAFTQPGATGPLDLSVGGLDANQRLLLLVDGVRFDQRTLQPYRTGPAPRAFPYEEVPVTLTTWKTWREAHPSTEASIARAQMQRPVRDSKSTPASTRPGPAGSG